MIDILSPAGLQTAGTLPRRFTNRAERRVQQSAFLEAERAIFIVVGMRFPALCDAARRVQAL
jgi:hypothetical protein